MLSLISCITLALGLSACDSCDREESERHKHEYITAVTEPTCTARGYTTYTCGCGSSYVADYTDPLNHDFDGTVCTRCGYILHDHDYERSTVEPDCTNQGYTQGVCKICGATYKTNIVDPFGHDYDNGTCNRCGYFNPEEHKHIYPTQKTVDPDCTHRGYTEYACACGYSYSGNFIDAFGHNHIQGKCMRCGDILATAGLLYTPNGDNYVCSGIGTATETDIIIAPEYNGKRVEAIDSYAFKNNKRITSITAYDSLTGIWNEAFYGCSNLVKVTFGNSLFIGRRAFFECSSLKNLYLPQYTFSIEGNMFEGCDSLESITVAEGNERYHSAGNSIIETATKTLVVGSGSSVIPDDGSVTVIGEKAFSGRGSLINITIPGCVAQISRDAFRDCKNLKSVIMEEGVTTIDTDSFYNCENLANLTVPDSAVNINKYAFKFCREIENVKGSLFLLSLIYRTELKSVVITSGEIIDSDMFKGCKNLTSANIGDSVKTIDKFAFAFCTELKYVTIGEGLSSIEDYAFEYCYSLSTIRYKGTREMWNNISKGDDWDYGAGRKNGYGYYTVYCDDDEKID